MKNYEKELELLEHAHVEFQMDAIKHTKIHIQMLLLALNHKVWKEVIGQIPRIILAIPGSLLGVAPKGNVGSTKMGIFENRRH